MRTRFYQRLDTEVSRLGGLHNAHLHLDRAGTADPAYWPGADSETLSCLPLAAKHAMIPTLHQGPAYEPRELKRRVSGYVDMMVECGTRRADTVVDVTPDRVGLNAIAAMQEIKDERGHEIDLRLGTYSPMGYLDSEPTRWRLLEQGLAYADFIGSLPEKDDKDRYPAHIGFDQHLQRMIELSQRTAKEVHIHLDQRNEPGEDGTERLMRVLDHTTSPTSPEGEPLIWAVHVISPSTYEEGRFQDLLGSMAEHVVGVICCPSAALGMRQLRPLRTPTFNSIARVLDMLVAGVPVRIGSDNVDDICSPSTTANLVDEVLLLSAALRFYDIGVLARVAAGQRLEEQEVRRVRQHLESDAQEVARMLAEPPDQSLG